MMKKTMRRKRPSITVTGYAKSKAGCTVAMPNAARVLV